MWLQIQEGDIAMAMRRRVAGNSSQSTTGSTTVASSNSEGGAVAMDPDDLKRDLHKYEDDMGDSKGPKLTLMEEVLLLGLKDREVRWQSGRAHTHTHCYYSSFQFLVPLVQQLTSATRYPYYHFTRISGLSIEATYLGRATRVKCYVDVM